MTLESITINDDIRIPAEVTDLSSFRRWAASDSFPERGKISFLGGDLDIDMSPENINTHNTVKGCLTVALANLADEQNSGQVFPDGALIVSEEANLATEPDLVYVRFESLESGRVRLGDHPAGPDRTVELVGSPDLVVEIVSPSSVTKDKRKLRERYFLAGVTEYWLIDARREPLSFEVLVRGSKSFQPVAVDADGFAASPLWQRRFRLVREKHPTGLMRYRLESLVS